MSSFDREPMTSYWCSIATMVLSRVISEIFNVDKYRDLEIPVNGQSRSWMWFYSIDWVWFLIPIVTLSLRLPFWDIWLQKCRDHEIRVKGHSRSSVPTQIDPPHMISYWCSIATMGLSRTVSEISVENRKFSHPRVFASVLKGFSLDGYRAWGQKN